MYKLLIVEDEKWEREGLRDFLDWSGLGIEVAGCACNGVEGLRMAELHKPEIILTDIMMPKMDGIRMSQNIRAFLPDTRIIILSGYDDFQYAKQSFSFHAFAYVLKPVEKKHLEEVIFNALKTLDQEKSRNREREALKSQWMDHCSISRDRLLLDLLECKKGPDYVQELEPLNGLKLQEKQVAAVVSLYCDPEKTGSFVSASHDCSQEFINRFCMILKERGILFSFSKPFKEAVLYMNAPATQSELETELSQLKKDLKKELNIETIIGVGEAVDDFAEAPQSYTQAKEAISFRFLAEYGELLFHHRLEETSRKYPDKERSVILKTDGIIKKILYGIQKGDMDESTILVDDFLAALRENPLVSKMLLGCFFTEVMNGFNLLPPDNMGENGNEPDRNIKGVGMDFTALDSLSQTKRHLLGFLSRIAEHTTNRSSNEDEVAKKVIRIIERRYADELDLKLISGEIHLTPYYIGTIFKKHTGKLFSQYLTDYRIDRAKEMLQSGSIKVHHLAEAVGIRNSSYFCALFKNRFGISPGDYKDILKGRQEYV